MNENERKWLITQIQSSKPTIVVMETIIKVILIPQNRHSQKLYKTAKIW